MGINETAAQVFDVGMHATNGDGISAAPGEETLTRRQKRQREKNLRRIQNSINQAVTRGELAMKVMPHVAEQLAALATRLAAVEQQAQDQNRVLAYLIERGLWVQRFSDRAIFEEADFAQWLAAKAEEKRIADERAAAEASAKAAEEIPANS
jgi:hypothetical protein